MTHEEREALEAYLKGIVLNLPEKPGSYQYYDDEGTIIYVGKAKNLKRRVSSYFNKEQQSRKTAMLVSKIRNITYTVVNSEEDALLLENSLIKQYKHATANAEEPPTMAPTATSPRCMPCWISANASTIRDLATNR